MEFIIVTGISGAGKSRAISSLEDIGFYCVDNIPPSLIKNFAELCETNPHIEKAAVVTDSRGGTFFNDLVEVLNDFDANNKSYKILFLDATVDVLVNRFKETRRNNARADVYENLFAAGVVDPAKVTRVALENAASIAGMFLTTECVIVEKKEDKPEMPMGAPGMGGMGGMM